MAKPPHDPGHRRILRLVAWPVGIVVCLHLLTYRRGEWSWANVPLRLKELVAFVVFAAIAIGLGFLGEWYWRQTGWSAEGIARQRKKREDWHKNPICPACGYDLRASPERCPECGRRSEPP